MSGDMGSVLPNGAGTAFLAPEPRESGQICPGALSPFDAACFFGVESQVSEGF